MYFMWIFSFINQCVSNEICITVSPVVGNLFYSKSFKGCFQKALAHTLFHNNEIVNKMTLNVLTMFNSIILKATHEKEMLKIKLYKNVF